MTAEKIILKYQEKGVKLFLNEDKLQFSGPKGIIDDDARKELQAYKDDIITYLKSHKGQVVCDKTQRFLPFEMTDIQVAYVIGRNRTYQYGGIGCKIYAEYEFPKLDLEKLERAWENVVKNNDMLHAVIKNNKEQQILQDYEVPAIEKWKIEDISPDERKNKLNEIRDRLVMKQYKVGEWPFGKIDSYYSHQQIKKTENITERVPLIFPDTAEIMEYLPDEIYLSAEYSRIDELHWYNVQTNSEYRNIIQEALLKLMISQEYEYVNRLAENVKRKLENKREESKTWYRIWLEIETVTEKKNYGYEALDSYKINGRIAAFCAEALCSGICQKGIYWPFEILDAEIVMNSLINEEILIGLKENDKKMQEHDLNYEEGEL